MKDPVLGGASFDLAPPLLTCTCSSAPGRTVLALRGEVDLASVALLDEWLSAALALEQPVVVDLEEVTFLDSSGIAALLRALERGPLELRSASPMVLRCLELTGVDQLLLPAPAPAVAAAVVAAAAEA